MRTAVISGGVVANIVLAGDEWTPPEGSTAVASETAEIGDLYSGGSFTKPPPPVLPPPTIDELLTYAAARRGRSKRPASPSPARQSTPAARARA